MSTSYVALLSMVLAVARMGLWFRIRVQRHPLPTLLMIKILYDLTYETLGVVVIKYVPPFRYIYIYTHIYIYICMYIYIYVCKRLCSTFAITSGSFFQDLCLAAGVPDAGQATEEVEPDNRKDDGLGEQRQTQSQGCC